MAMTKKEKEQLEEKDRAITLLRLSQMPAFLGPDIPAPGYGKTTIGWKVFSHGRIGRYRSTPAACVEVDENDKDREYGGRQGPTELYSTAERALNDARALLLAAAVDEYLRIEEYVLGIKGDRP